jgi:cobalt/nickel transport system permease protein
MMMMAESRKSWVHNCSPWSKLIFMFLGIILLILIDNLVAILLLYLFILAIYISAHLPLKKLKEWYFIPLLISLSIVIPLTFNRPGDNCLLFIDLIWFDIFLTQNGFEALLIFIFRALSSVTISFIFTMTTKYKEIAYLMYKLFPQSFATISLLTYRYIFLMMDEISGRITASKVRGGSLLGYTANLKNLSSVIALSIINGIERGTRLAKAMEIRGGGNEAIYVNDVVKKPRMLSYLIIMLLIFFIIMVILFGFGSSIKILVDLFIIK